MPGIFRHRFIDLRLRHTLRIAREASDARRNVVAELEHNGLVGLGEAAPILRYRQTADSAAGAPHRKLHEELGTQARLIVAHEIVPFEGLELDAELGSMKVFRQISGD